MIESHPLDTPINRASIAQLPIEELKAFVERLQERRLESYNIYQAGLQAKAKAKSVKQAAEMEKRLEQFAKGLEQADRMLTKLEKYATEIQAYRLVLGDYSGQD